MSRQKCSACGLVNFADQDSCKRCRTPLEKQPELTAEQRRAKLNEPYAALAPSEVPPSVGTYNGIGTRMLGWRHHEDGTATTTVWFTMLYLPLFPMARWRLVSPTKDDFEPTISWRQLLAFIIPDKSVSTDLAVVTLHANSRQKRRFNDLSVDLRSLVDDLAGLRAGGAHATASPDARWTLK